MFTTQVRIRSKRQFGRVGAFKEGHGDGFEHYSIVFPDRGTGVLF